MDKVISADGTAIAYEAVGSGPVVVLVGGAFCDHNTTTALAAELSADFTAVSYDRRGRGESGDTLPYDVAREVEDITALVTRFGDRAALHGISSGGALCLVAAASGAPVGAVSAFEPPYRVTDDGPALPADYVETLDRFTAEGRRGDAVAYFMTAAVGQSQDEVDAVRNSPMWPALEAMAPTLAYDAHCLGGAASRLPESMLASLGVPVLGLYSTASPGWMQAGAVAVAKTVRHGEHTGLDGSFHDVPVTALAPVLRDFYLRSDTASTAR
jgi:hypothetical protein